MSLVLDGSLGVTFPASNTPSFTNYQGGAIASGTAVASTSGTSITFSSIPSWVKRITVMFSGVSTTGTSNIQVQLGTSGGIVTTGYASQASSGSTATASTTGLLSQYSNAAAATWYGLQVITLLGSNIYTSAGNLSRSDVAGTITNQFNSGGVTLSSALTQIAITTVGGTDTFDAGSINILYE